MEPDLVSTVYAHVDVETTGELTDGRTVIDIDRTGDRGRRRPNVNVALHADAEAFRDIMLRILATTI